MKLKFTFVAGLLTLFVSSAVWANEPPEVTEEGLHRVPDSKMALVYAQPGADLKQYQRVRLDDAVVAFRKNWLRDQRAAAGRNLGPSKGDMEKIKENLATEFHEVFKTTLTEGGYELADENAEDVLRVRPAIVNLDVNAPDRSSAMRTSSYTASAGEMTLYIELYDSVTGALIAKAVDRRIDNERNRTAYTWTTSATNKKAADRILKGWANILLDALNESRE